MNNTRTTILSTAAALFAARGFDALSMRDIAGACQIKAPSLYNHFSDKKSLYQETLQFVFEGHAASLLACLHGDEPAQEKLGEFIRLICQRLDEQPVFRQLFMRELVEQDEERSKFLVNVVMKDTCDALHAVFLDINPACDPHFLTTSLVGLVIFHFQINPMRPYLPGGSKEAQSVDYLATNIQALITPALISKALTQPATDEPLQAITG